MAGNDARRGSGRSSSPRRRWPGWSNGSAAARWCCGRPPRDRHASPSEAGRDLRARVWRGAPGCAVRGARLRVAGRDGGVAGAAGVSAAALDSGAGAVAFVLARRRVPVPVAPVVGFAVDARRVVRVAAARAGAFRGRGAVGAGCAGAALPPSASPRPPARPLHRRARARPWRSRSRRPHEPRAGGHRRPVGRRQPAPRLERARSGGRSRRDRAGDDACHACRAVRSRVAPPVSTPPGSPRRSPCRGRRGSSSCL